jgi:hypothetical protein
MSLGGSGAPSGGSIGGGGYEVHFTGSGLNDGHDDGPTIASNIATCAGLGWRLVLHGLLFVNSTIACPHDGTAALVHLAGNCEIRCNISGAAVFLADSLSTAANPSGGAVTVSGSPAAGAKSVTVNALNGLVAGDTIMFSDAAQTYIETHTVRSGSSGATLLLNEPISVPPPTNVPVKKLSGLACLQITGDPGSKMTGAAMEGIQIFCGRYCKIAGITISMAFSGTLPWATYFDWATRDSEMSDVTIVADATNPGTTAVGAEQCINLSIERVKVVQTANHFTGAFVSTTGTNVWFRECWATGSNYGLDFDVVDSNGTFGTYGHRGSGAIGCHFEDSVNAITIKNGGSGIHIIGCHAPRSSGWAVNVYAPDTSVYPENVVITGGDFTYSTGTAVLCSGGTGHRFSGFDATGSVTTIQVSGGVVHADGFTADNNTGSAIWHAGGDAQYANFSADGCTYATQGAIRVNGGNKRVSFSQFSARSATYAGLDVQSTSASLSVNFTDGDITDSGASGNQNAVLYSGRINVKGLAAGYRTDPGSGARNGIRAGGTAYVKLKDVDVYAQATPGGNRIAFTVDTTTTTLETEGVRIVNVGSAGLNGGANYGIYTPAAGTVRDKGGSDLSFAGANAILLAAAASVTMMQGGQPPAAVSATASLTFPQHYANAIELAAAAAANSTITTYPFPGLRFTARNLTAAKTLTIITSTSGDTGVVVAAGKSAIVEVEASDAKMVRVTADT